MIGWQPKRWSIHACNTVVTKPGSLGFAVLIVAVLIGGESPTTGLADASRAEYAAPLHQQLVGAWRLMKIEVTGSRGAVRDPFYQADSVGTIIYDASGWMSVQIAAPRRDNFKAPVGRGQGGVPLRLAAFDTYYAYFGTWSVDEATARVSHHVVASLFPAETGADYSQTITIDGDRLTFTGPDTIAGEAVTRTKIWQRLPDLR